MQTGDANSTVDLAAAKAAAELAEAAAKKAEDASTAAQDAANAVAATDFRDAAVKAQKAAEEAQKNAETARDDAVADAAAELKIKDTVKSVGDTTIDAAASSSVVTTDGETVDTGLQDNGDNPMATGGPIVGVEFAQDTDNEPANGDQTRAHVQAVTERTFPIGKVVDSADDMARLMIVTQYAGSDSVYVYATMGGTDLTGRRISSSRIQTEGQLTETTDDDTFVSLRSVGAFYLAGEAADNDGLAFWRRCRHDGGSRACLFVCEHAGPLPTRQMLTRQ